VIHVQGIMNGRILDPDTPVEMVDLPPLDLPPLRTHERFMREHFFWRWLEVQAEPITDADLRRFKRRERDRARREAKR
jgi:hypothetical protein